MYDFVPAELTCSTCGKRDSYLIQTHLFERERLKYEVGDEAEISFWDDNQYIILERSRSREPEHVSALELWYCMDCRAPNIARIDIDDAKITGVCSIVPSPSTLAPVTRLSFRVNRNYFRPVVERMFADAPEGALLGITLQEMIDAIVDGELYAGHDHEFAEDES